MTVSERISLELGKYPIAKVSAWVQSPSTHLSLCIPFDEHGNFCLFTAQEGFDGKHVKCHGYRMCQEDGKLFMTWCYEEDPTWRIGEWIELEGVWHEEELHLTTWQRKEHLDGSSSRYDELAELLTSIFSDDKLAELVIAAMVSRVSVRKDALIGDSLLVGYLPLNLVTEEVDVVCEVLSRITTPGGAMSKDLALIPSIDDETGLLTEAQLLRSEGSVAVLSEQDSVVPLKEREESLAVFIREQKLQIDTGLDKHTIPINNPVLLVTQRPSKLLDHHVKVGSVLKKDELSNFASYLRQASHHKVALSESLSKQIQEDYVIQRQTDPSFDANALSRCINLMRLMAMARMQDEITWVDYQRAKQLNSLK